jgi:hypothetical protein
MSAPSITGLRSRSQRSTTRAVRAADHLGVETPARLFCFRFEHFVRERLVQRPAAAVQRPVQPDRAGLDADEMQAEEQRRGQIGIGEVDRAVDLDQLRELALEPNH